MLDGVRSSLDCVFLTAEAALQDLTNQRLTLLAVDGHSPLRFYARNWPTSPSSYKITGPKVFKLSKTDRICVSKKFTSYRGLNN